ncbi:adenine phosphoribosyltransferase-like [Mytilus trossulus]|uniref:adenine phosphoribosyltransferase-like n=1 Tax=Mytilus trossulus TaxID=6551 RepID=UPI003006B003
MTTEEKIAKIKQCITDHPDFPKPGVLFWDIFPVLRDASVFKMLTDVLVDHVKSKSPNVEVIVGLDSRGFLFGPIMAQELGISFVPVRKAGKLPGETFQVTYSLEYGQDKFEIQKDSIKPGAKVVIVDDLLATGGTMKAACELLEKASGDVLDCLVVIELSDLKGRDRISKTLSSLIQY